jgi:hypothetical protein
MRGSSPKFSRNEKRANVTRMLFDNSIHKAIRNVLECETTIKQKDEVHMKEIPNIRQRDVHDVADTVKDLVALANLAELQLHRLLARLGTRG